MLTRDFPHSLVGHTRDRYELESLQFVVIQKQNVTKPTNWNRYSKRFPVGGLYMGYLRLGIAFFVCLNLKSRARTASAYKL